MFLFQGINYQAEKMSMFMKYWASVALLLPVLLHLTLTIEDLCEIEKLINAATLPLLYIYIQYVSRSCVNILRSGRGNSGFKIGLSLISPENLECQWEA